jgi:hypothetical protein
MTDPTPTTTTLWRTPSGRLHRMRYCSSGAHPRNTTRVQLADAELAPLEYGAPDTRLCRCALRVRDQARQRLAAAGRRVDSPAYRADYERGWRYAWRPTATLDHLDARGASEAAYDGYLDAAAGREKWHRLHCADHDACP